MSLAYKLAGEFTLSISDRETGKVRQELKFPNLILNAGLDAIGNQAIGSMLHNVALSTSAVAPAVTDTVMGGTIISSGVASPIFASVSVPGVSPDYIFAARIGRRFDTGAAAGTWSMIGVRTDSGVVFAKTLIKDAGGNPTSITVLASEILDVRYEIRIIPDVTTRGPFVVNVNGTNYSATLRQACLTDTGAFFPYRPLGNPDSYGYSPRGTLHGAAIGGTSEHYALAGVGSPSTTQFITGSVSGNVNPTYGVYTSGNYYRDLTFTFPTTETPLNNKVTGMSMTLGSFMGNVGILINGGVQANGIPKGNTETLAFTVRCSWARA